MFLSPQVSRSPLKFANTTTITIHKYLPVLTNRLPRIFRNLENALGAKFGDTEDPLLVSVRSGAAVSMPGMMDTILNLGLNDDAVKDSSRSLKTSVSLTMHTAALFRCLETLCCGLTMMSLNICLKKRKKAKGVTLDTELEASDLMELVKEFKSVIKQRSGNDFLMSHAVS